MKRSYTPKQVEYRSKVINKSLYVPKKLRHPENQHPETFLDEKIMYLKNCISWIEEYRKGYMAKEKVVKAMESMEMHLKEIKKTI